MKRSILLLVSIFLVLLLATTGFAKSGSGVIPHLLRNGTAGRIFLYVSNITSSTVTVTITFFDSSGSVITEDADNDCFAYNVSNYDDSVTGASISFDLGGNDTGHIRLQLANAQDPPDYGYGIIKWEQDSNARFALIAHCAMSYDNNAGDFSDYAVQINNGLPF